MKRALLIVMGILLVASLASAQPGKIQLFSDPGLTSCDFSDDGIVMVYIYHINTNVATASQFMVEQVNLINLTFLGQISPFPNVIGNAMTGIAIAYGSCLGGGTGPIELLTLTFAGAGSSPPCSSLEIVDHPIAVPPGLYVTDCLLPTPSLLLGDGSVGIFNTDGSCDCGQPLPAEETSWGKIKALYK